jgi:predicted outer membrane protein
MLKKTDVKKSIVENGVFRKTTLKNLSNKFDNKYFNVVSNTHHSVIKNIFLKNHEEKDSEITANRIMLEVLTRQRKFLK